MRGSLSVINQSTSKKPPNTINNDVKCDSKLEDQSIFLAAFLPTEVLIGEVKHVCVEN